ncbi:hypothetical protein CTI12_AA219360 [Artemisia annua]|uniref:Uncharacterized protein n=1 Tax=Artemisia annua TaxID=35608 RepID=A0A2U1NXG9_ARTAN|nr:hypothetical protein CTI12_AA219360 [Artemisia annua]
MEFCQNTHYWLDKWVGDQTLKDAYPLIFALELDKEINVAAKLQQIDVVWSSVGDSDSDIAFVSAMAGMVSESSVKEDAKGYFGDLVFFALVARVGS